MSASSGSVQVAKMTVVWFGRRKGRRPRIRRRSNMTAAHDRGGWPADELIDREEHEWADWERQTQSLAVVLGAKEIMNVDQMRRGIESMGTAEYETVSYFERWSASIETLLVEKGILTTEEIDERTEVLLDRWGYTE